MTAPRPLNPARLLVIGHSNIGDAVLMSPVIAWLHAAFPQAHLTLVVGERAEAVFARDPRVQQLLTMERFGGWWGRLRLVGLVWRVRPDVLIDLRRTVLPLFWKPWRAWRYAWPLPPAAVHMRERHLLRLERQIGIPVSLPSAPGGTPTIWISPEDQAAVDALIRRWGIDPAKRLVVICPGARSHIKRWYADRFAQVATRLIEEEQVEVIFTGEPDEAPIVHEVLDAMRHRAHSAVGSTTICQLAALMRRAALVLTNDSAALHLAGAVGTPVLALFGPTDPDKYGPTGPHDRIIQRRLFCVPCEAALCRFNHECMRFISADDVYDAAQYLLDTVQQGAKSPP